MSMPKISTRAVCVNGKIRDKKLDSESSSSFSQWKTVGGKKWEQDLQMRLFRCILWQILTSLAPSGRSLSTKTPLPSYLRFLITPKPVSKYNLRSSCYTTLLSYPNVCLLHLSYGMLSQDLLGNPFQLTLLRENWRLTFLKKHFVPLRL